jgi:ribosomal protein L11 methyltransferase
VRNYPALEVRFATPADDDRLALLVADLDDFQPTAVHDNDEPVRVFFASGASRDAALAHLRHREDLTATAVDVPHEDWAARSQAALTPIVIGRLTVAPPWTVTDDLRASAPGPVILIQPSMGFGTGHHASTRLCLRLLQEMALSGKSVVDVGTGSGVLAIAASLLGAAAVAGVDFDRDALTNARENLELNSPAARVDFREHDLSSGPGDLAGAFDLVVANLTGGLICRRGDALAALARPGASLIASGFQTHELQDVSAALREAGWTCTSHLTEQDWVGARYEMTPTSPSASTES